MAIQLRRGQEADFDESKLAQGEVAITVDTDEMFYKGANVKKVQEALEFDSTPTANSTNPVTSGGIKTAIDSVSGEASDVSSKVGDLANLQTTAKTNVVAAINEIDGDVDTVNQEVESLGDEIDGKVGTSVPRDAGKVSIIYPSSDDDPLYVYRGNGGGWSRITAYTEFGASPTIARGYDSTKTYNTGDYVRKSRQILRCLEDNVTGEWDSTKWTVVVLADELSSEISDLKDKISNKADVIVSSASGVIASFTDGADGLPLKKATYYIEPKQSGTGDPSPDNIRPISGWTGMTVQRTGKNRCTPGELGTVSESSPAGRPYKSVQIGSTTRMRSKNLIPVVVGQSFTVSFNSADYHVAFMGFDSNGLYLGYGSSWRVFQTASPTSASWANAAYIAIVLRKADNSTMTLADWDNAQIQVDIGNTATDFEPYTGQTIPITFPTSAGTVYGGDVTLNEDGSGVLTVDKGMFLLDGTETSGFALISATGNFGRFQKVINGASVLTYKDQIITNLLPSYDYTNNAQKWSSPNESCTVVGVSGAEGRLFLVIDGVTTVEQAMTFFQANPCTIVYTLKTPATYTLTAEQVSTLLGANNIWCDTGNTSVEYRADTKLYIDGLIGTTDDDYTADQNIASGQFFSIGNHLYRATSAIASGATIVPGTNCVETNIAEQLTALYASLT